MRKTLFAVIVGLLLGAATVATLATVTGQQKKTSPTRSERREIREQRRAERLAAFEKFIDSIVLAHSFQFNPQTMQRQPAGPTRMINNPNYMLTLWNNTADICLPYVKGYTPPYYLTVINYTVSNLGNFITEQTPEGWNVSFTNSLFSGTTYTFTFEISKKMGGATLTITNPWYSPVQYFGTITQVY